VPAPLAHSGPGAWRSPGRRRGALELPRAPAEELSAWRPGLAAVLAVRRPTGWQRRHCAPARWRTPPNPKVKHAGGGAVLSRCERCTRIRAPMSEDTCPWSRARGDDEAGDARCGLSAATAPPPPPGQSPRAAAQAERRAAPRCARGPAPRSPPWPGQRTAASTAATAAVCTGTCSAEERRAPGAAARGRALGNCSDLHLRGSRSSVATRESRAATLRNHPQHCSAGAKLLRPTAGCRDLARSR
jgi:hypothetical protein